MAARIPFTASRLFRLLIGLPVALTAGLALPMSAAAAAGRLAVIDLRCDAAVFAVDGGSYVFSTVLPAAR